MSPVPYTEKPNPAPFCQAGRGLFSVSAGHAGVVRSSLGRLPIDTTAKSIARGLMSCASFQVMRLSLAVRDLFQEVLFAMEEGDTLPATLRQLESRGEATAFNTDHVCGSVKPFPDRRALIRSIGCSTAFTSNHERTMVQKRSRPIGLTPIFAIGLMTCSSTSRWTR